MLDADMMLLTIYDVVVDGDGHDVVVDGDDVVTGMVRSLPRSRHWLGCRSCWSLRFYSQLIG